MENENNELQGVESNETIETNPNPDSVETIETNPDSNKGEIMIPKSRFEEVQAKAKAIETEIAEIKAKLEAGSKEGTNGPEDGEDEADEEFTAKQVELNDMNQKIESLSKEAEAKQKRIDEITATIDELAKSQVDSIPADIRDLVPDTDSLSQIAWIAKAEAKGLFESVPDTSREPLGRKTNVSKATIDNIAQAVGGSLGMISAGYNERSRRY